MAKNLKCNFPLRWGLIVLITICLLSHFHVSAIGGLPSHKPSNGTLIYLDPDTKTTFSFYSMMRRIGLMIKKTSLIISTIMEINIR